MNTDARALTDAVKESAKYFNRKDNDFFDKLTSTFTIRMLRFLQLTTGVRYSYMMIDCASVKAADGVEAADMSNYLFLHPGRSSRTFSRTSQEFFKNS